MRKNRFFITLAAVLLALTLCAPLFLFPAYADESDGPVIPETVAQDPSVQKKAADTVFDDFSKASVSWKSQNEIMTVTSPAFEGSRSLRFVSDARLSVGKNANKTRFVLITVLSYGEDVPFTFSTEGNVVYSKTVNIGGGEWQTFVFDLNDEANIVPHAEKSGNRFSAFVLSAEGGQPVYADLCIGLNDKEGLEALRYGGEWTASGGVFENGTFTLDKGAKGQYLSGSPDFAFGKGKGVGIKLINLSSAASLSISYTDGAGSPHNESKKLSSVSTEQFVAFGVTSDGVSDIKIGVDDFSEGEIKINGIFPVSTVSTEENGKVKISSCRLVDSGSVSVKADAPFFDETAAALYECKNGDPNDLTVLATGRVKDGQVTLSADVPRVSAPFTLYCAEITDENGIVYRDYSYPTNLSEFSRETLDVIPKSVKGVTDGYENYMTDGAGVVLVNLNVGNMLSAEDGISSSAPNGQTYLFNIEAVEKLDRKMYGFQSRGVAVLINVYYEPTGDVTLDGIVSDPEAMRAVVSFVCDRYGVSGGVSENLLGVILGKRANDGNGKTLSEYAEYYAELYRKTKTTVALSNPKIEVYVPLCGRFYSDATENETGLFPAERFITELKNALEKYGAVDISLSYDVFGGTGKGLSLTESYISAQNLPLLDSFAFENGIDNIIIFGGEDDGDLNKKIRNCASYAVAVNYALYSGRGFIKAVVPAFTADYSQTLKYADTDQCKSKLGFISDEIDGVSELLSLSVNGGALYEYQALEKRPSLTGEASIMSFDENGEGFYPTDNDMEYNLGHLRFLSKPSSPSGIIRDGVVDLDGIDYLSFDLALSSLDDGKTGGNVTVILYSGKNRIVASGRVGVAESVPFIVPVPENVNSVDRIAVLLTDNDVSTPELIISGVSLMSTTKTDREIIENKGGGTRQKPVYPLEKIIAAALLLLIVTATIVARAVRRKNKNAKENLK